MKKLYVGSLPFEFNSKELEALFAEFGKVLSATIIMDKYSGQSKGFGFVEMDNDNAKKAIDSLNGKEIKGRSIRVSEAKPMERSGNFKRSY